MALDCGPHRHISSLSGPPCQCLFIHLLWVGGFRVRQPSISTPQHNFCLCSFGLKFLSIILQGHLLGPSCQLVQAHSQLSIIPLLLSYSWMLATALEQTCSGPCPNQTLTHGSHLAKQWLAVEGAALLWMLWPLLLPQMLFAYQTTSNRLDNVSKDNSFVHVVHTFHFQFIFACSVWERERMLGDWECFCDIM